MRAALQLIGKPRFADDRGWFNEVMSDARLAGFGIADRRRDPPQDRRLNRILVTGGSGQLGTALVRHAWPDGWEIMAF